MTPLLWLLLFLIVLTALSLLVYGLVVYFFYWGDKDGPPTKKRR